MKTIMVGTKEYPMLKVGRAQAEQIINLTKWLAKYGGEFFDSAQDENGNVQFGSVADIFVKVAEVLTVDAIIELYMVVTGCTLKEANDNFDVAQLVDVATSLFDEQPSFKRVFDRFFSPRTSTVAAGVPSTSSEQPTDGQTTK